MIDIPKLVIAFCIKLLTDRSVPLFREESRVIQWTISLQIHEWPSKLKKWSGQHVFGVFLYTKARIYTSPLLWQMPMALSSPDTRWEAIIWVIGRSSGRHMKDLHTFPCKEALFLLLSAGEWSSNDASIL